ncbi:prohead protease [Pontimonas phage phiPsal1]|nr:prohead protease [Pontimonas phage phiPsal1]
MPYLITDNAEGCPGWATIKDDGEVMGCHESKQEAIDQALAIAQAEGSEYLGERSTRDLPDNYRPATSEDVPEGRACGNCMFFNEDNVDAEGRAFCERWEEYVEGGFYCNAWEPREEARQVDLTPPAYMRASARRGLEWHSEGLSGDGLETNTVEEARALAEGNVTPAKWGRIAAFIARHLVDLEAPAASPDHPDYPSPGVVSMALWGGGVNKMQAERAMEYARGVVSRLEEENEGRVTGEALSQLETRHFSGDLELRETPEGMRLEGYAARFNEFSEPLPFREKIAPGAFKRSLQSRNDVKLLWNHDSSTVLGSTRAGTLRLTEDEYGLRVSAELPDTQAGRDARVLIQRRDVTAFSFGFTVPKGGDTWNSDGSERTLNSIRLFEVSTGVAFPAYPTTDGTATVRGLARVAQRAQVDVDALADAVLKIENGEDISADDRVMIESVLNELAPAPEEAEPAVSEDEEKARQLLQLKKKKLQLLMGF